MNTINILAFLLPVILFIYWGTLGYATLSMLRTQRNLMQNLLMAPSVGITVTLIPLFLLNRLVDLPLKSFSITVTLVLLALSLVILWWKKPLIPIRRYLPFAAIFLLTLFLIGRPLLEFGFHWFSYGNDDMTNYCLKALRKLNFGFLDTPNANNIINGSNYSLFYWFIDVPGMDRIGADLFLSWLSALTHLTTIEIFMPVILAFHLALISTATALMYLSKRWYRSALTFCILLAVSPSTTLGTIYQLIAQALGLGLLCLASILLMQSYSGLNFKNCIKQSILLAIALSALLLSYPEVFPFLALATIAYFAISLIKGWRPQKSFYITACVTAVLSILILNFHIINVIYYVFLQTKQTSATLDVNNAVFPYYLLPSGLANLWGILPITVLPAEPWLSLSILFGGCLLIFTIAITIWFIYKKTYLPPVICMTLVMLIVAGILFAKNVDFGLFKVAMFLQPFLLGTLIIAVNEGLHNKLYKVVIFSFLIIVGIFNQSFYVDKSYGTKSAGFTEIPFASSTKINVEFSNLISSIPEDKMIILDTPNNSLAKLQSVLLSGRRSEFLVDNYFKTYYDGYDKVLSTFLPKLKKINDQLALHAEERYVKANFNLHNNNNPNLTDEFTHRDLTIKDINNAYLVITSPLQSIFNRREFNNINYNNFTVKPITQTQDHLIFVNSEKGRHYFVHNPYIVDPAEIAFSHLESDYFFPGKSFASVGQYLLFQILNPSPKARLELNITATLNSDGNNSLPHVAVIGNTRTYFPIMGRGSAHIFSSPITPQVIKNIPYLTIDMEKRGVRFLSQKRTGLFNLYNKNVLLDRRIAVTFARNISLVSDEQYANLNAPISLSNFPSDLGNPDLEYSGIYEDGWISEDAFFGLKQPNQQAKLIVKGILPEINNNTAPSELTISIDGKKISRQKLMPGNFNISLDVPYSKQRHKVELHFSKLLSLPNGDNRPVAAKIDYIGFDKLG